MNRNAVMARKLEGIARLLVAGMENFGYYSIDFDKEKRTFTVYFILKEDAVRRVLNSNGLDGKNW